MSTSKNGLPIIQHYVPQFLLRNFECEKNKIWAFDKQLENEFKTHIKNIASENAFYNLGEDNNFYSIEPQLAKLEENSSKIIKKIIDEENIGWLNDNDKHWLALFIAVQSFRTLHARNHLEHFDNLLKNRLMQCGIDPFNVENYKPLTKEEIKLLSIQQVAEIKDFTSHILNKAWILLKGKKTNPFYISDNPVALQNMHDFGPRGNIGFAVKGIEIYCPLSSSLTLAMHCPTMAKEIREGYNKFKFYSKIMPQLLPKELLLDETKRTLEKTIAAFDKGIAFESSDENILNLNYLQVKYAERFVFCENNDFDLVKDMIKETTDYKIGPRLSCQ